MIVCGSVGVGKDYVVHQEPNWVNLDFPFFEEDLPKEQSIQKYIKAIKYLSENRFNIIIPDIESLRRALIKDGIKYTYVIKLNGEEIKILENESIALLTKDKYLIDYVQGSKMKTSLKEESAVEEKKRRWWNGRHG